MLTELPLKFLRSEDATIEFTRSEYIAETELKKMLTAGKVQFVIANVGNPIEWQDIGNCYEFWKSEVKPHLSLDTEVIDVSVFPGEYTYVASRWENASGQCVVLLEVHH